MGGRYGPSELRVWYLAPDRFRAEGEVPSRFVAVGDSHASHIYFPEHRLAFWISADDAPELLAVPLTVGGDEGPLAEARWTASRHLSRAAAGEEGVSLLPNDVVAGRQCLAIETRWERKSAQGPERSHMAGTIEYVDADLGIPLHLEAIEPRQETIYIATDVRVGVALDEELFSFDVPEGTVVYRYPLEFYDADAIARALKEPAGRRILYFAFPDQTRMVPIWSPEYLPPGFRWASTSTAGEPLPGEDWEIGAQLVAPDGGVIEFTQGTEEYEVGGEHEDPAKAPEVEAVTIKTIFGPRPGHIYRYREPYWQTVVVWSQERKHYWLEGVGVSEEELVKMAESMRKYSLRPRSP